MDKAPKIGDRVQVKAGHRYHPCTGTVTKVHPSREVLNDEELIEDDEALPVYGTTKPEREWRVTMKVDTKPANWIYGENDKFCPGVDELEPAQ